MLLVLPALASGWSPGWVGPRLNLGVAVTRMSAPPAVKLDTQDLDSQSTGLSGPQLPMVGVGARMGVGLEVGLVQPDGAHLVPSVLVEVGYQSLFGTVAGGAGAGGGAATQSSSLQLGYGWLAAQLQKGRVTAALGPTWGGGKALVLEEEELLAGKMVGGGATGGLSVRVLELDDFSGALGVFSGTLYDGSRWYPWGEVALVVSPVPMRRI